MGGGNGYQIIAAKEEERVILLINKSADMLSIDAQYNKLQGTSIEAFSFDEYDYLASIYTISNKPRKLEDLVKNSSSISVQELLSVANAISEMAGI